MKIIDFLCKNDPLGNKNEVCPCNFSFFMQVPWADVLVQEQSQLQSHKSPEEQNRHISVLEPAQALLTTQWSASNHGFVCSKVLPHHWYIKLCVISKPLLMRWQHTYLSLCFVLLFRYSMYKTMPYFSSSLAYISPLAQTADIHTLLLGFLGKGQRRYTLLCAFRSMLGDSCSTRAPLHAHHGSTRQPGYGDIPWDVNLCSCLVLACSAPGSCTRTAAPRACCCSAWAETRLIYLVLLCPPSLTLPSSLSSVSFCSSGCSWLMLGRLRDPWIRAEPTARQHMSLAFLLQDICTKIWLLGKILLRQ